MEEDVEEAFGVCKLNGNQTYFPQVILQGGHMKNRLLFLQETQAHREIDSSPPTTALQFLCFLNSCRHMHSNYRLFYDYLFAFHLGGAWECLAKSLCHQQVRWSCSKGQVAFATSSLIVTFGSSLPHLSC